jgi:hypothetical protein
MPVTTTPRLGIKQWSADTDPAITRVGMDADFAQLEALCAIFGTGVLSSLAASLVGRILRASDTGAFLYDTGSALVGLGQGFLPYGNGSDGAVTLAVNTTLTRDMYYDTLTVPLGITLKTNGFRLFCRTQLILNGTISIAGNAAAGATGGLSTAGNADFLTAGLGMLGIGGDGTTATSGAGGTPATGTNTLGGAGGAGGAGTNAGGAAAVPSGLSAIQGGPAPADLLTLISGLVHNVQSLISNPTTWGQIQGGVGGSAGGGDGTNAGGGGGGGGGVMGIYARQITGTGTITCAGGPGGNGASGNTGGGGGGGGGVLFLVTNNLVVPVTLTVAGGPGGAKSGTGLVGASGATGRLLQLLGV